jgi:hypothetical protein
VRSSAFERAGTIKMFLSSFSLAATFFRKFYNTQIAALNTTAINRKIKQEEKEENKKKKKRRKKKKKEKEKKKKKSKKRRKKEEQEE